jgi:hypothetical protein
VTLLNGLAYIADDVAGLQVVNYLPYDNRGQPPTVTLVADGLAQGVEEAKPVRIAARVTDDVQVRQVQFFVNGVLAFVDGSFPFEYRFTAPRRTAEQTSITVRAVATDTGGNSAATADLVIPLPEDTSPPRIVRAWPALGGSRVSQLIAFASEPLDPASLTEATFLVFAAGMDGLPGTPDDVAVGNGTARWVPELGAAMLDFPTPLPEGRYRARLTTGVKDMTGHPLEEPFEWQFSNNSVAWIGGASGSWHDPAQWSTGAVPGDGDSVVIDVPGDLTITFNRDAVRLRRILCGNNLEIAGGALTVDETIEVTRQLRLSGGTLRTGTVLGGPEAVVLVPAQGRPTLDGVTLNLPTILSDSAHVIVLHGLTLDSTLTLTRSFGRPMVLEFAGEQTLAGTGSVVFADVDGWSQLRPTAGTLTLGPGITIRGGSGTVGDPNQPLVNHGTVHADTRFGRLTLQASVLTSDGTLRASNGGTLSANNVQNRGTGQVDGASTLALEGQWRNTGSLTLAGGTLVLGGSFGKAELGLIQRDGGEVVLTGTFENSGGTFDLDAHGGAWRLAGGRFHGGTLDGVTLNGNVRLDDSAILTVTSGLTLNGTLTLTRSAGRYMAVEFAGEQTLAGTGSVVFDDIDGWSQLRPTAGTLTIGSSMTIRGGSGTIGNPGLPLINEGTVLADVANRTLTIRASPFVNHGSVTEANGGKVVLPP